MAGGQPVLSRGRQAMRVRELLATAVLTAGTMGAVTSSAEGQASPGGDLVQVATAAGNFTTLLKAVEAAGLVEVLRGDGPFTLFAPTDAAFAKLPAGALDALLADEDALASVLTYHVLAGKVTAADVVRMGRATPETVQGQKLTIVVRDGVVHIND